jgi:Phage capsid family
MSMLRADLRDVVPFKREPLPLPPGNSFRRGIAAKAIAVLQRKSVADVVAEHWPSDRILAQTVARAASAPAMTTVTGWAAELVRQRVADALDALGPASAGARLLQECLLLSFDDGGIINAPGFTASAANAGFVVEGNPIPVRQLAATPAQLLPYKLASIAVLTEELVASSNAEAAIGDSLVRSAGLALDVALFDSNAADAARPAGLRYGIAASTASNNADGQQAFFEDIVTLMGAVSAVAGAGPIVLVAGAGRGIVMGLRAISAEKLVIFGSAAVGNDLIAIAPAGVVAALDPEPEIETSNAATVVMDTAPGAAGTMGPERSAFQTASVALKMRWPVSWARRSAAAVAWLTPVWK